jgi:hypothetical protein
MKMPNVPRLQLLERLPKFQPWPSPRTDRQLMINMTRDREAGLSRTLLPSEEAASARQGAAAETQARRMGFRSFGDAERLAGEIR